MDSHTLRFYYRGEVREVGGVAATRTVLQHLREDLNCTGTKEGCAEGDCGACTVVVGEPDGEGGVSLRAVNACIQFLPTLDGRALYTVEDLRRADGTLHPVQQAMVDCHGSQCGFCTPGFVMSMWALYQNVDPAAGAPTREDIDEALSGNLCRCTGYRPIIDATRTMVDYPPAGGDRIDRDALARTLASLDRTETLDYPYLDANGNAHRFIAPRTLAAFADYRAALPEARVLAGSTDIGLWVTKQFRDLGDILYIGNVAELRAIDVGADTLTVGAAAKLQDAFGAIAADYPEVTELWKRFASVPIRNAGTLGGNVANGSPIGDSMPALIALGAQVVLRHGAQQRTLPLDAFYLAYQKTALTPGEFVEAIRVPRPTHDLRFRTYKLSKRYDSDISAVCGAFAIRLKEGSIAEARIAYGGVAATPKRAASVEAVLTGAPWTEATVRAAMDALSADYAPLSDMRASDAYRAKTARNLLYRFWLETRDAAPLDLAEVNVFAAPDAWATA
ncbi:xanthine dehydrogenase small subunit [Pararobbsia silviterrae]|uniref:Xanthine dehydrogenase small subunit n=1 Tax=Pararobbsia silviterrae TaxID=1792498 RepID=A0A494YFV8_9BURK|nr:xanthine dehydrogenase small subunit [Pararobbsia silviterrae]RKP59233.1 xanthine dehydrogenase small subunit [Pararobbsia silviterrae]